MLGILAETTNDSVTEVIVAIPSVIFFPGSYYQGRSYTFQNEGVARGGEGADRDLR